MARVLIVGCGCRGRQLARELGARGHAVRGTTRDGNRAAEIERVGAEAFLADPDRVATLAGALDSVAVVCLLLGSAEGAPEDVEALHGSRLAMLLQRIIDTAVRGLAYEAVGTVEGGVLRGGAATVRSSCERSRIPYALLDADPGDRERWVAATVCAVEGLLGCGRLASAEIG